MSHDPVISHGRGGAGNINPDENAYTDGEIVREGPLGTQGDGAYSTGVRSLSPFPLIPSRSHSRIVTTANTLIHLQRGGAGNIDSPSLAPRKASIAAPAGDADVIPEPALKRGGYENFHTGRGGEGNVHKDKEKEKEKGAGGEKAQKEGVVKKVEHLFGGRKEGEGK